MERKIEFRHIEGTWGVAIDLTAELRDEGGDDVLLVVGDLRVSTGGSVRLDGEQLRFIELGLQRVWEELPLKGLTTVVITELRFNPCDYQPEGLACAMCQWFEEEMGILLDDKPKLRFSSETNRYSIF